MRPAADQLATSQAAWIEQLQRDASSATANRDWLTAELALRQLTRLLPDDQQIATQLADVVRQHAPVVFTRDGAVFLDGPDWRPGRRLDQAAGRRLSVVES